MAPRRSISTPIRMRWSCSAPPASSCRWCAASASARCWAISGAGAILGPLALGSFKDEVPFLRWVTVIDAQNVSDFADLGVVFLLFLIGLELSYERLLTMRRLVFGLGSLQVVAVARP